jgi:hypothetical protein
MVASRRLRQENCEFKGSLGYIARPCLKKKKSQVSQPGIYRITEIYTIVCE